MNWLNRLCTVSAFALAGLVAAPVAGQRCIGDCNSSGSVTVDELLVGLNIALGSDRIDECAAFEDTVDGEVTVDELVEGVRNALQGCVRPTATPTVRTATPTPTAR
jgi:hypothetical protein